MKTLLSALLLTVSATAAWADGHAKATPVDLGPRPLWLVDRMDDSPLKQTLQACQGPFTKSDWSIGHRGAPMQFPEHTRESYVAGARMGAGILECDVTFTKDKELVCRHAQNDLHTTTNILATPLASKCTAGFTPAEGEEDAKAECRASDITLAEFKTLEGKMDAANKKATTVEAYLDATAGWRTDLYAGSGTLMTHKESIELFKSLGAKFTPELKSPSVEMPFEGYTQEMYAQALIDEYKAAGIPASDVWAQSFNLEDVLYWIENEPEFGKQAVYLDDSYNIDGWSPEDESTWPDTKQSLYDRGVRYIAPPLWVLVKVENGKMVPSLYAKRAKEAGLNIISWTVERSGLLKSGGGWYYQTVKDVTDNEGDVFELMHVLHKDVGVVGIFSDWPATSTFYANCMGLK
ncbi:MAG: glycerophosphodiester phosphodiesterase family protein [Pseudomonadota bacterium]